jgi:hypothetical protein
VARHRSGRPPAEPAPEPSLPIRRLALLLALALPAALRAQSEALPPDSLRFTNAGVLRADSAVEAVFVARTRMVDTVAIGDFASHLLARLGVPPFEDSLAFLVTADSSRVRIQGRLKDFPPESREELGPIFSFIDSLTPFVATISMPQHSGGIMRFRLERVTVSGFPIPDILLLPALQEYDRRYPVLASRGREFLVAMPPEGEARLLENGIELRMTGR